MEQHRPLPNIHPFHRLICFLWRCIFSTAPKERIVDFGNLTVTNTYPKPIDGIMVDMFLLWTWNCSLWSLNIHTKDSCLRVLFGEPASFYWCFKHFLAITTLCGDGKTNIKIWSSKLLIPPNIKQLQRSSSNSRDFPNQRMETKLWDHGPSCQQRGLPPGQGQLIVKKVVVLWIMSFVAC